MLIFIIIMARVTASGISHLAMWINPITDKRSDKLNKNWPPVKRDTCVVLHMQKVNKSTVGQ